MDLQFSRRYATPEHLRAFASWLVDLIGAYGVPLERFCLIGGRLAHLTIVDYEEGSLAPLVWRWYRCPTSCGGWMSGPAIRVHSAPSTLWSVPMARGRAGSRSSLCTSNDQEKGGYPMDRSRYQCYACGTLIDSDEECPECGADGEDIYDSEADGEEDEDEEDQT